MAEGIRNLRQLAKDQIENRFKLIQDGAYIPNDILSITLKSLCITINKSYFIILRLILSFFYSHS